MARLPMCWTLAFSESVLDRRALRARQVTRIAQAEDRGVDTSDRVENAWLGRTRVEVQFMKNPSDRLVRTVISVGTSTDCHPPVSPHMEPGTSASFRYL